MAKVEIVNVDMVELSFQILIYDITREYYGSEIWWKVGPIIEPTTDGYSSDMLLTFNGDTSIPKGVTTCLSDRIYGYDWQEASDITPDSGFSKLGVGLKYNIRFNYRLEDVFGVFTSVDNVIIFKDSSSYVVDLPLTIKQIQPGSDGAYFECDFSGLFWGDIADNEYSSIRIYSDADDILVADFLLKDIEIKFDGAERNGNKVKWSMLVGNQFNKPYGFYIRATTHTRPSIEYDWDSPEATHTVSYSDVVYIVLVQEGVPECHLPVMYTKVSVEDSFKKEIIGVIEDYPIIRAEDWNQFCKDINTVRKNAYPTPLNEWFFYEVKSGEAISGFLHFNNLYDAIADMCPSGIIEPPTLDDVWLVSGAEFSGNAIGKFISSLVQTAQACRNHYWGINE